MARISPEYPELPAKFHGKKETLPFCVTGRKWDIHTLFLQPSFSLLLRVMIWQYPTSSLLMINPTRALLSPAATIPFPRDVLSSQLLATY